MLGSEEDEKTRLRREKQRRHQRNREQANRNRESRERSSKRDRNHRKRTGSGRGRGKGAAKKLKQNHRDDIAFNTACRDFRSSYLLRKSTLEIDDISCENSVTVWINLQNDGDHDHDASASGRLLGRTQDSDGGRQVRETLCTFEIFEYASGLTRQACIVESNCFEFEPTGRRGAPGAGATRNTCRPARPTAASSRSSATRYATQMKLEFRTFRRMWMKQIVYDSAAGVRT